MASAKPLSGGTPLQALIYVGGRSSIREAFAACSVPEGSPLARAAAGHLAMQAAVRQLRDHRLQGFPLAVGGEIVGCGVSGSQSGKISSRMVHLLIVCLVECLASNQHFAGGSGRFYQS